MCNLSHLGVSSRLIHVSVPIHSFGYGRSHDPASLWLISNHTSGTYTFVKDWLVGFMKVSSNTDMV